MVFLWFSYSHYQRVSIQTGPLQEATAVATVEATMNVPTLMPLPSEPGMLSMLNGDPEGTPTRWGPSLLAKLVNITPISLWFMVYITIVNGG